MATGTLLTLEQAKTLLSEATLKRLAEDIAKQRLVATFTSTGDAVVAVNGHVIPLFHILSLVAPYETPHR